MKPLTDAELALNQQAASMASAVLGEAVEAATRCEQVTTDMAAQAAGVGAGSRFMMRGMRKLGGVTNVGQMGNALESGGLPNSFVLAVTATQVAAIEDKHDVNALPAGKVLKSWPREGFRASRGADVANRAQGLPDDRQMLVLYLPIEGGNNRYLKAAAYNTEQTGGMPHRFAVGKDAASQAVIDKLATGGAAAGANIIVGGQSLEEMVSQAQQAAAGAAGAAAADPIDRLGKLAELHKQGVLTDEEFAAQKAKILSET